MKWIAMIILAILIMTEAAGDGYISTEPMPAEPKIFVWQ